MAWLGRWLRKRRIVSGNPRCQKPFFLKEIPIQDVAIQDFTCEGKWEWTGKARQDAETSDSTPPSWNTGSEELCSKGL